MTDTRSAVGVIEKTEEGSIVVVNVNVIADF